jgi:hypothetical protein
MTPVKPILKPINKHLMETSDGADELCAVADLLEQAARKLRRITENMISGRRSASSINNSRERTSLGLYSVLDWPAPSRGGSRGRIATG